MFLNVPVSKACLLHFALTQQFPTLHIEGFSLAPAWLAILTFLEGWLARHCKFWELFWRVLMSSCIHMVSDPPKTWWEKLRQFTSEFVFWVTCKPSLLLWIISLSCPFVEVSHLSFSSEVNHLPLFLCSWGESPLFPIWGESPLLRWCASLWGFIAVFPSP